MKTVKEMAAWTGVSARTLHHYDAIGLLKPAKVTEAGYRLYDEGCIERLYLIRLFQELGFPLKQIADILDAPDYDRNRILEQQILLLKKKKEHLENLIHLAQGIKQTGVRYLEFPKGYDPKKIDEYSAQAKTLYGKTDAYKEYEQKSKNRSKEENSALGDGVMNLFARLGQLRGEDPGSQAVQSWVAELQAYFTEHFYTCTPQILQGLGQMYAGGGSMTENIDAAGGAGTGEFACKAIEIYCSK